MNAFDSYIISFFNQFVCLSGVLNKYFYYCHQCNILTWIPIISLLWWYWFRSDGQEISNHKTIISIIISCLFIAAVVCVCREARPLFRLRPMINPQSNFHIPYGINLLDAKSGWGATSSFPSGHGAILTTVSVGLLYISRPMGVFCLIYSFVICAFRIFFGFHYATDMIVGALLGVAMLYLANTKFVEKLFTHHILKWSTVHPSSFYAALFIATLDISMGFNESKHIIDLLACHI
jgi:undecaprenyl-diphosphatase